MRNLERVLCVVSGLLLSLMTLDAMQQIGGNEQRFTIRCNKNALINNVRLSILNQSEFFKAMLQEPGGLVPLHEIDRDIMQVVLCYMKLIRDEQYAGLTNRDIIEKIGRDLYSKNFSKEEIVNCLNVANYLDIPLLLTTLILIAAQNYESYDSGGFFENLSMWFHLYRCNKKEDYWPQEDDLIAVIKNAHANGHVRILNGKSVSKVTLLELVAYGCIQPDSRYQKHTIEGYVSMLLEEKDFQVLQDFLDMLGEYDIPHAQLAHQSLVDCVKKMSLDDMTILFNELVQSDESSLKIILRLRAAEEFGEDLDELPSREFVILLSKVWIDCPCKQTDKKTIFFTEPYLDVVLPILPAFTGLPVRSISLEGNELTDLPESILQLTDLEEINIANNPFQNPVEVCNLLLRLPLIKDLDITR